MGGVIVFPLRVLRLGAHFGETPRVRQPSGHLCERSPFPLPAACGRRPVRHPQQKAPERSATCRRANGDAKTEYAPPQPACRPR
jgi:hypothetical protein